MDFLTKIAWTIEREPWHADAYAGVGYPKLTLVSHDGEAYLSMKDNNLARPDDEESWKRMSKSMTVDDMNEEQRAAILALCMGSHIVGSESEIEAMVKEDGKFYYSYEE